MRALVVYDSVYGNTQKVAQAIGDGIGASIQVVRAAAVRASDLEGLELLVVGSATHGGRPTEALQGFLARVEGISWDGIKVAGFDTRLATKLVAVFGYAAKRIAAELEGRGGKLVAPPEGFVVRGRKGPLQEGEVERATAWGRKISTEG
jgi:flavodoxin